MSPSDPELMRIFDFTADDLEANRDGRISERQRDQLITNIYKDKLIIKRLLIGLFAFLAFFFVAIPFNTFTSRLSQTLLLGLIFTIAFLLISGFIYLGVLDKNTDLLKGKVAVEFGRAYLYLDAFGRHYPLEYKKSVLGFYSYFIRVGSVGFPLSYRVGVEFEAHYLKLENDISYRFYYLPDSTKLLSVEVANKQ